MKKPHYIALFILWVLLFLMGINKHHRFGIYNYQSELWADKSGYYVYLPALHLYDFDAARFPAEVDELTGQGFKLDSATGKVVTKYTYGVALLEAPFYFTAHFISKISGYPSDGFSVVYQKLLNLAASFYGSFALVLLFVVLARKWGRLIAGISCFLILFGTNLLYYIIDESGMSHVYSFFLACGVLYWWHERKAARVSTGMAALLGIAIGLITVIRPTNLLLLAFIPLSNYQNRPAWLRQWQSVLQVRVVSFVILGAALTWLPQILYWHYLTGEFVYYSYENEGFNWLDPQILPSLFAPLNGLFLYSPLYLFLGIGMVITALGGSAIGRINTVLFLATIYLFSSWWAWHFGCSFGGRSYIEYLSVFSLTLGELLHRMGKMKSVKWRGSLIAVLIIFTLYSIRMNYAISECFFGDGVWDWNRYRELLF